MCPNPNVTRSSSDGDSDTNKRKGRKMAHVQIGRQTQWLFFSLNPQICANIMQDLQSDNRNYSNFSGSSAVGPCRGSDVSRLSDQLCLQCSNSAYATAQLSSLHNSASTLIHNIMQPNMFYNNLNGGPTFVRMHSAMFRC